MYQREGVDTLPAHLVDTLPAHLEATYGIAITRTSAGRGPRLPSMTLMLKSGWAAVPFMEGYARVVQLTDDERERLPGLLFSRRLIDLVFRVCCNPNTTVSAAKKLGPLRRDSDAKARDLLELT